MRVPVFFVLSINFAENFLNLLKYSYLKLKLELSVGGHNFTENYKPIL